MLYDINQLWFKKVYCPKEENTQLSVTNDHNYYMSTGNKNKSTLETTDANKVVSDYNQYHEDHHWRSFYGEQIRQPKYILPFVRRLIPRDTRNSYSNAFWTISQNTKSKVCIPSKSVKDWYSSVKRNRSTKSGKSKSNERIENIPLPKDIMQQSDSMISIIKAPAKACKKQAKKQRVRK